MIKAHSLNDKDMRYLSHFPKADTNALGWEEVERIMVEVKDEQIIQACLFTKKGYLELLWDYETGNWR